MGHLLKIDPESTGATARRLSRGKSPLKGRGARGGAGAVEPGLTLLLIPWRGSSKAAGLWYRNRCNPWNCCTSPYLTFLLTLHCYSQTFTYS
ncbi:DNA replication licensing factor mcm5-A [Trichinella pseudospiralis]